MRCTTYNNDNSEGPTSHEAPTMSKKIDVSNLTPKISANQDKKEMKLWYKQYSLNMAPCAKNKHLKDKDLWIFVENNSQIFHKK